MSRKKIRNKRYIILIVNVFVLFFMTYTLIGNAGNAEEKETYKYYKNIVIQVGGSLYDYADEYADSVHYSSKEDYVREVMFMNHIEDLNHVHPGDYLIIPYYSNVLR